MISIHEAFADLDARLKAAILSSAISIHEAFADLDPKCFVCTINFNPNFNPRGLRRPRRNTTCGDAAEYRISIHEAFADLDRGRKNSGAKAENFNPRGLRRPRQRNGGKQNDRLNNFNPRGLRRPRPWRHEVVNNSLEFQSTRPSQTSTKATPAKDRQ